MQIKNFGMQPSINGAPHKDEKDKTAGTESFQAYLQNRMNKSDQQGAAAGGAQTDGLHKIDEIEAIAARSRIHRDLDSDVSDFLELIHKKDYLLGGVDFDNQAALSEDSSGNKTLSAEQAAVLREKYDVDNLPPQEQYALFQKLTELGVITKSDVQNTRFTVAPDKDDLMGYLADEAEFRDVSDVPETKPKGRLDIMIHNERFAYSHVQNKYGKRCQTVAELADSHQKVLDTLKQI